MSAGVCGFGSALSVEPARPASPRLGFGAGTICASAEASWNVAADLRLCARHRHRIGGFGGRRCGHHAGRSRFLGLGGSAGALVILVGRLAALEQRGEQARLLADGCSIVAIAAAFDVGAGQLIALQRIAIGGQMHGASVREHPGELIVGHARPVTDAAGIEMDEGRSRGRIEADAAALQAEPGGADLLKRHVRNVEVHGVAEHVLAEARHAGGAAAEHGVGGGGAVGGDDLDRLLAVDVAVDFPEDVEQMTIHRGLSPGCASRGGSD